MEKIRNISHLKLIDWDFHKEDSRIFLHNFCWYPARFIPIIPAYLIEALSDENDVILDPFCGSGTTVIEALKRNRNAIGFDIQPIAVFITNIKAKVLLDNDIDISILKELRNYIYTVNNKNRLNRTLFERLITNIPNYDQNKDWYHDETLTILAILFNQIENIPNGLTKDICKLFFLSILMQSTGYENNKSYAYYADNVKPKKDKLYKNAFNFYLQKLDKFLNEYKKKEFNNDKDIYHKIYNENAKSISKFLSQEVDLIITSPPYLNVTDYITGYRLAFLWYDFISDESEFKKLRKQEIGSRSKRKNKNALENYLEEMNACLNEMGTVLKRNKYMCIVLGETKKNYDIIRGQLFEHLIKNLKMKYVDSYIRNIQKKFFIHPYGGGVKTEEILIFKK